MKPDEPTSEGIVLDFKAERTRRKTKNKVKDDNYKPDFKKFQAFLDKSDTDNKK